jgi:predicted nuclease of predicted toxin-antitoxin system
VRFLRDANLSPRLVEPLGVAGYQARYVAGLELLAATDATVFDRAANDGDVVITADSDFSTLLASRGSARPSVILLRHVAEPVPPRRSTASDRVRIHPPDRSCTATAGARDL